MIREITKMLWAAVVVFSWSGFEANAQVDSDPCLPRLSLAQESSIISSLMSIDRHQADDAMQQARMAFVIACRAGVVIDNPAAWVRTVAKNRLLNMKKKDRLRVETEQMAAESPVDELGLRARKLDESTTLFFDPRAPMNESDQRKLNERLTVWRKTSPQLFDVSRTLSERLSKETLSALYAKYVEELSSREIAVTTGEPLTTVQGRIRRGKNALRDVLPTVLPPPQPPHPLLHNSYAPYDYSGIGLVALLIIVALGIVLGVVKAAASASDVLRATAAESAARTPAVAAWHHSRAAQAVKVASP